MHGVHGVCRRVPGREHSAILVGTEKGSNTGGEMASPRTLTLCRCSSSRLIFLGLVVVAKATGHWQTNLPRDMYMDLVSHSREASHPGM